MKINYTNWGANSPKGNWQFATPYFNIIRYTGTTRVEGYTQISFVVGAHHWWINFNHKNSSK